MIIECNAYITVEVACSASMFTHWDKTCFTYAFQWLTYALFGMHLEYINLSLVKILFKCLTSLYCHKG